MQRFWLPIILQLSHPWWYWKRAERWVRVFWLLLLLIFLQEERNNLEYSASCFTPSFRRSLNSALAENDFLKNKKPGPRLTIIPSPLQQQAYLRVCGTENPAAVTVLISRAEAAVPVCSVACGFWHHVRGWTSAVLDFLVTCAQFGSLLRSGCTWHL